MMLAFELSTRRGSIVLHDGSRVLAEAHWEEPAARHPVLFDRLPELLTGAGVEWRAIESFAVGRGPGSFSGIRTALTAARSAALPGRQPVYAVASGEALAAEAWTHAVHARPPKPSAIVIAGDARRGQIWHGLFRHHVTGLRQEGDWSLSPAPDFAGHLPAESLVVTSDWARLNRACGPTAIDDERVRWIREDCFPSAAGVAELAWRRIRGNAPSDPLEPLYMHPPV